MAQMVKNSPAIWETWVQSLGWEDPLEKETEVKILEVAPVSVSGLLRPEFQDLQCEVPRTLHHESLCLGPTDSLRLIVPLLPHTVCG